MNAEEIKLKYKKKMIQFLRLENASRYLRDNDMPYERMSGFMDCIEKIENFPPFENEIGTIPANNNWGGTCTYECDRKIIGYKAPYDMFGGKIKKGAIYSRDISISGVNSVIGVYHPARFDRDSNTELPSEIVETWEPCYEESIGDKLDKILSEYRCNSLQTSNADNIAKSKILELFKK